MKPRFNVNDLDNKNEKNEKRNSDMCKALGIDKEKMIECVGKHGPRDHPSKTEMILGIWEDTQYDVNTRLMGIFTIGALMERMHNEVASIDEEIKNFVQMLAKKKGIDVSVFKQEME